MQPEINCIYNGFQPCRKHGTVTCSNCSLPDNPMVFASSSVNFTREDLANLDKIADKASEKRMKSILANNKITKRKENKKLMPWQKRKN